MPAVDRRARKRARKARGEDDAFWEAMEAYIRTRIVCDRCGLEQPFRYVGDKLPEPCAGPLGLPCNSETAVWLDSWEEMNPERETAPLR
jgi:hypothetical protein